jgi:pyruvate dehydrogenase E2 component (dihydrolipoamide acetyltransferase)
VSIDEGLITPIVQNADQKTLFQISSDAKSLIKKAKEGKLSPQEYQGGSITISNMGMMKVKEFGAIINPPQSCIVAIAATEKRAMVDENDQIKVKNVCTITLSADHRVIDGSDLANFANTIKNITENPLLMLL